VLVGLFVVGVILVVGFTLLVDETPPQATIEEAARITNPNNANLFFI
jgi:hypothetical protein